MLIFKKDHAHVLYAFLHYFFARIFYYTSYIQIGYAQLHILHVGAKVNDNDVCMISGIEDSRGGILLAVEQLQHIQK